MGEVQQAGLEAAEQELARILQGTGKGPDVAAELFDLADLLRQQGSLLRALTNPGRDADDRKQLVYSIIGSVYAPQTIAMVSWLLDQHWSKPQRFVDSIEHLGVIAVLFGAKERGELGHVGGELFNVRRLLSDNRDLRIQLSDLSQRPMDDRLGLLEKLLGGRVLPPTMALTRRAVYTADHGHLIRLLRDYDQQASRLEGSQLVSVTTAAPFSDEQRDRLKAILEKQVGRSVIMAVIVDPGLIGGFRIDYGDESADSSIRTEIGEARRQLVR